MLAAVFDVRVVKKTSLALDLEFKSPQPGVQLGYTPSLALRALADPPGSPLAGEPLYDPGWTAAQLAGLFESVELLKRAPRGDAVTYRLRFQDPGWPAFLRRGQAWRTRHHPTDDRTLIDAAWLPDGKSALLARRSGVAVLQGATKRGLGRLKAWLPHLEICAVDASADGALLMTVGGREIALWEARKGGFVSAHVIVGAPLTAGRFAPGGDALLGDAEGRVQLVRPAGEAVEVLRSWETGSPITALAVAPVGPADGADFAAAIGCADGSVWRWAPLGGEPPLQIDAHDGPVTAVDLSAARLISGGADETVKLWRPGGTLEAAHDYAKQSGPAIVVSAFSPDRRELLFSSYYEVGVVDLETGAAELLSPALPAYEVAYSADGRYRIGVQKGPLGLAHIWDRQGRSALGLELPRIIDGRRWQSGLAASPDGRWLAAASSDGKKRAVYQISSDGEPGARHPHPNERWGGYGAICFIDDARYAVSLSRSDDFGVHVWSVQGGEPVGICRRNVVTSLAASADGSGRFAAAGNRVEIWSPDLERLQVFTSSRAEGTSGMFWSPDGRRLLGVAGRPWIYELDTGAAWSIDRPARVYRALAFSPDGRLLAAGSNEREGVAPGIYLWDLDTQRVALHITPDVHPESLAFTPDGAALWVSSTRRVTRYGLDGAEQLRHALPPPRPIDRAIGSVSLISGGALAVPRSSDSPEDLNGEVCLGWIPTGWRAHAAYPSPDGRRALALCGDRARITEN